MAITLIDKIKPKNNGKFPLVDAEDVLMPDGKRLSEFEGGSGGGLNITDDGNGNVTIASTGSVSITDDGEGNVTIA